MPDNPPGNKYISAKYRWAIFLIGMILISYGQVRLASDQPSSHPPLEMGQWLNDTLHLAIPSIDNVLNGLPLLLLGGGLLVLVMRGVRLLPTINPTAPKAVKSGRTPLSQWPWLIGGIAAFGVLIWGISSQELQTYQTALWITALLAVGIAITTWDQSRGTDLSPHVTRTDLLWIMGFLLCGLIIGVYRLQGHPNQLMGDEGSFWQIARDIARGDFNPSIFAVGVYTFPVFSSIFPAWIMEIFGINLWGWRFSSVLIGLLTVPPLYFLTRDAFNRKIAIATCVVLITSPYFLVFSRLGYNNIQAVFITTLALYWLFTGLQRKSYLYYYLAGCAAGLGYYVYFGARFAIAVCLAFFILIWVGKKIKFREFTLAITILLLGFMLVATPHIIYGIRHDSQALSYKTWESVFFNTFNGMQFYDREELFSFSPPFSINNNELFFNPKIYLELIARGFIRTMLAFQKPWLISEHYIAFPLAGSIGVFFYLFGLAIAFLNIKQSRNLLLILWFFANTVGLSTLNTVPPRHTHMVAIIPALAILTAVGVYSIANTVASLSKKIARHQTLILAILLSVTAIGGLTDYFIRMPPKYKPHPDQIVLWAGLDVKNEKLVYVYTDPAEKEFMPKMVTPFRESVVVEAVPFEDIINGTRKFLNAPPTIIFYPPEIRADLSTKLQSQLGGSLIQKTFTSTDGTPVLAASMNTPFTFETEKPLATVIKESYLHFSLDILLGCIFLVILLTSLLPSSWTVKFPKVLQQLIDWINRPDPHKPPAAEEDVFFVEDELSYLEEEVVDEEPPEWALDKFVESEPAQNNGGFRLLFKRVKTPDGSDLYIKIQLPRFHFKQHEITKKVVTAESASHLSLALHIPEAHLLLNLILVAFGAQLAIHFQAQSAGIILYLLSAVGLLYWAQRHPKWRTAFSHQIRLTPQIERFIFLTLMIVMAYLRVFDLSYRVYGLEADETKWTVQSWYSTILHVDRGEFASMHYIHVPVSFWVRSFFLRTFGINFISARIESAIYSLITLGFLYLLVKLLTHTTTAALLSTAFYGFSFIELNASHQALHNTVIEPWMLGAVFFLFWGLQDRKLWKLQFSGILLGFGMLTYETFYPTVVLSIIYLLGLAIRELHQRKESVSNWLKYILLVSWPVILVYTGFTRAYMTGRQSYWLGWLNTSAGNHDLIGYFFQNTLNLFKTIFSHVVYTDSLLNWQGPLISGLLLPFIVVGFIYNLWNLRRPGYAFFPLWFLVQILPGPIVAGSVWPRVLYSALAPVMIWGAFGFLVFIGALRSWFSNKVINLATPAIAIILVSIFANNYYIFSSMLTDPIDRQKRRELADLTFTSASEADFILLPYIPNLGDSVELESHVILFSVAGAKKAGLDAGNYFEQVEMDQLLTSLWEHRDEKNLDIIFDKTAQSAAENRQGTLDVLLKCYPGVNEKSEGTFFDVYSFSSQALRAPACFQPIAPTPVFPEYGSEAKYNSPLLFSWDTNGTKTTSFTLQIDTQVQNIYWLEAEDNFIGEGWHASADFVSGFSGTGFLLDDWKAGQVVHHFNVPESGPYRAWVRSYKREENDQQNYLTINDERVAFAENNSPLNKWTWKDLGVFSLNAGETPISLSRDYGQDEQFSVFVDVVLLTPNLDFNPGIDHIWVSAFTTGEIKSNASQYLLVEALPPGVYRWNVRIFDTGRILDSTGENGIQSNFAPFKIVP